MSKRTSTTNYIALLGDSTLDNEQHVQQGEASMIRHLSRLCPDGVGVDLLAKDGAMIADISEQLKGLRAEHTNLVVSVGGNDLLMKQMILSEQTENVAEALYKMHSLMDEFDLNYDAMCESLDLTGLPVLLCTIYVPIMPAAPPMLEEVYAASVALFNDLIYQAAQRYGFPVLDLRHVCTECEDFVSLIEPSDQGGRKIAEAIASRMVVVADASGSSNGNGAANADATAALGAGGRRQDE